MNTNTPRIGTRSFVCLALATLATSIGLSGYAHADGTISVSERVSTAGLDLGTLEGARALYIRLKVAAWRVCRDNALVALEPAAPSCREDVLGDAIRAVNRPLVTKFYLKSHSIETAQAHGITIPITVANR